MKYRYVVIRSVRKTVSIDVSLDNKITVRAPWSMPIKDLEQFVESKLEWIYKVVNANAEAFYANVGVAYYKEVFVDGVKLPLIFCDENKITDEAVYLKKREDICATYKNHFMPRLLKEVSELAALTQTFPAAITVKSFKGKWGSCDPKNNISFNFMIFMLPRKLQRYVIIHELCHTICHNHSAGFWKLVSDYLPDYKKSKAQLKKYDFLTTLY